jgi:hypothetical protein
MSAQKGAYFCEEMVQFVSWPLGHHQDAPVRQVPNESTDGMTNGNPSRGETKANSLHVSRIVDHNSFAVHAGSVTYPREYCPTSKSRDSLADGPAARVFGTARKE